MNPKFQILAGAVYIQIENFNGQVLGRITDLGIDLANGRIVEVPVGYDRSGLLDHRPFRRRYTNVFSLSAL